MPEIWSVINLTPDSFYSASRVKAADFLSSCLRALEEGADRLDIGAESTRPFSKQVSFDEEWGRLAQPLKDLKKELGDTDFQRRVSIDTRKAEIAERCLDLGAGCINDTSFAADDRMISTVIAAGCEYVLMHAQGSPENMQKNPDYNDAVAEVMQQMKDKSDDLIAGGMNKADLIWDYGIGFGKKLEHNLALISATAEFSSQGYRLMAGVSRKSMFRDLLGYDDAAERRVPTAITQTYIALQGASILRVHDTKDASDLKKLIGALQ